MMTIIAQANDSRDGDIWEQDEFWEDTLQLMAKKDWTDFSRAETSLVEGTFKGMLQSFRIEDTGFDSYQQIRNIFDER
jgi:hypothetical protein